MIDISVYMNDNLFHDFMKLTKFAYFLVAVPAFAKESSSK